MKKSWIIVQSKWAKLFAELNMFQKYNFELISYIESISLKFEY